MKFFLTFVGQTSLWKTVLLLLLLLGLVPSARAQRRFALDAGVGVGGAYYIGDHNSRRQFFNTSAVWEGLAKMSLDEHNVLRMEAASAGLQTGDGGEAGIVHVGVGYEFNFYPYDLQQPKPPYTPYVFLGVGYTFFSAPETATAGSRDGSGLVLPFGLGVKWKVSSRWTAGAEWSFAKTCTDRLDGRESASHQALHNNDWYSFALVTVTVRVLQPKRHCSSYL